MYKIFVKLKFRVLQEARLNLSRLSEWYNAILTDTEKCELDLVRAELQGIDKMLAPALSSHNWKNFGSTLVLKKKNTHFQVMVIEFHLIMLRRSTVHRRNLRCYQKLVQSCNESKS